MATETDPLLHKARNAQPTESKVKGPAGPLEMSKSDQYAILAGVWMATFLGVGVEFNTSTDDDACYVFRVSEISSGKLARNTYLLATCTFTPLYGRLCNVMGRRGANQTALAFAALGTITRLARNMETLILARFLAGIGGGGIFTTSTIIVSDMYTLRDRGLGWRAAFLPQAPLYLLSFSLTPYNLRYVTPGKSKGAIEVLKRIDYFGSLTLFVSVGSLLLFLSMRYNDTLPWSDPWVITPLTMAFVFMVLFFIVEIFVAPDPILAPVMLRQKVPLLVGVSNFLSATCNFSVNYVYPVWFQVVTLESASTVGTDISLRIHSHLDVSMSTGAVFAGWMMYKMGRYKAITIIFGILPFVGAVLISRMREDDSGSLQSWLSISPCWHTYQIAAGTGFNQLFRGIGQVGGVAISFALFQTRLGSALRACIRTPNAEELILKIRRSSDFICAPSPTEQRAARDAYAVGLRSVYALAAGATLLAYLARLPIPDMDLDAAYARRKQQSTLSETVAFSGTETPPAEEPRVKKRLTAAV
ncbi:vacuolar amino acid permease [Mycena alexandri]|uniref:Vacuolar amino acid permease n=1 Tax=Mycena alexandri TaxID=1745969 RepID=A0AAD6XBH5_9AGAR|nr:vacuolar amino acid permease [Mycena alexandri]